VGVERGVGGVKEWLPSRTAITCVKLSDQRVVRRPRTMLSRRKSHLAVGGEQGHSTPAPVELLGTSNAEMPQPTTA